jgi:hypothetical protein
LLSADAAQYRRGAKTVGHRQVSALPAAGKAQLQAGPGAHGEPRPAQLCPAIQAQRQIRAAYRQPGIAFGLQLDIAQGDFQQRRAPGVVQKAIGPGRRMQIQRPGRRHTEVLPALAAAILQQAQRPGFQHAQARHG